MLKPLFIGHISYKTSSHLNSNCGVWMYQFLFFSAFCFSCFNDRKVIFLDFDFVSEYSLSLSLSLSSIFQIRVYNNNTSEHIYNRLSASFFIRKYLLSVCNKSANKTLALLLLLGLWLCAVCLVSYLPGRLIFRFISNAHPFALRNPKPKFSFAHTDGFLCDNNTTQRNATQFARANETEENLKQIESLKTLVRLLKFEFSHSKAKTKLCEKN